MKIRKKRIILQIEGRKDSMLWLEWSMNSGGHRYNGPAVIDYMNEYKEFWLKGVFQKFEEYS